MIIVMSRHQAVAVLRVCDKALSDGIDLPLVEDKAMFYLGEDLRKALYPWRFFLDAFFDRVQALKYRYPCKRGSEALKN